MKRCHDAVWQAPEGCDVAATTGVGPHGIDDATPPPRVKPRMEDPGEGLHTHDGCHEDSTPTTGVLDELLEVPSPAASFLTAQGLDAIRVCALGKVASAWGGHLDEHHQPVRPRQSVARPTARTWDLCMPPTPPACLVALDTVRRVVQDAVAAAVFLPEDVFLAWTRTAFVKTVASLAVFSSRAGTVRAACLDPGRFRWGVPPTGPVHIAQVPGRALVPGLAWAHLGPTRVVVSAELVASSDPVVLEAAVATAVTNACVWRDGTAADADADTNTAAVPRALSEFLSGPGWALAKLRAWAMVAQVTLGGLSGTVHINMGLPPSHELQVAHERLAFLGQKCFQVAGHHPASAQPPVDTHPGKDRVPEPPIGPPGPDAHMRSLSLSLSLSLSESSGSGTNPFAPEPSKDWAPTGTAFELWPWETPTPSSCEGGHGVGTAWGPPFVPSPSPASTPSYASVTSPWPGPGTSPGMGFTRSRSPSASPSPGHGLGPGSSPCRSVCTAGPVLPPGSALAANLLRNIEGDNKQRAVALARFRDGEARVAALITTALAGLQAVTRHALPAGSTGWVSAVQAVAGFATAFVGLGLVQAVAAVSLQACKRREDVLKRAIREGEATPCRVLLNNQILDMKCVRREPWPEVGTFYSALLGVVAALWRGTLVAPAPWAGAPIIARDMLWGPPGKTTFQVVSIKVRAVAIRINRPPSGAPSTEPLAVHITKANTEVTVPDIVALLTFLMQAAGMTGVMLITPHPRHVPTGQASFALPFVVDARGLVAPLSLPLALSPGHGRGHGHGHGHGPRAAAMLALHTAAARVFGGREPCLPPWIVVNRGVRSLNSGVLMVVTLGTLAPVTVNVFRVKVVLLGQATFADFQLAALAVALTLFGLGSAPGVVSPLPGSTLETARACLRDFVATLDTTRDFSGLQPPGPSTGTGTGTDTEPCNTSSCLFLDPRQGVGVGTALLRALEHCVGLAPGALLCSQ